jgi:exodeoxyribonuclease V alpha subunit
MQVRNDYDRDVFNGDVGVIIEVPHVDDPETGQPTLVIDFDGRRVELGPEEWGSVELAYAVTVHKSQGAEYPAVVIPLVPAHWLLLRRDLLYTAVTRGKRVVVLVGSRRALARAVQTVDAGSRATTLARRLAQPPSLLEGRGVT